MKKVIALAAILPILAICGCGTTVGKKIDQALFTPTAWVTNHYNETIRVIQTNQLVEVNSTNTATGEVTTRVVKEPVQITLAVPAHDDVKPISWEANKVTEAGITGLAGLVPGYGTAIGWGATALMGIVAAIRSRKYKDAAVSVAQGVEHFMASNPIVSTQLKNTLSAVQADHGTTSTVRDLLSTDVESRPKV